MAALVADSYVLYQTPTPLPFVVCIRTKDSTAPRLLYPRLCMRSASLRSSSAIGLEIKSHTPYPAHELTCGL